MDCLRFLAISKTCWACFLLGLIGVPSPIILAQDWQLTRLDGSSITAQVQSIDQGTVSLSSGSAEALDTFRILQTDHKLLGSDPTTTRITLRDAGQVFAREISIDKAVLKMETDVAQLEYDLFDVQCVYFKERQAEKELAELLAEPSTESDRLLVTTSQGPRTVSGLIEGLSEDSIQIDYQGTVRNIGLDKVVALLPAQLDSGREAIALVTCIDRSKLLAESLKFGDNNWEVEWGGRTTRLPADSVAQVQIRSDREINVSDLTPVRNEVQTQLSPVRSTAFDTNVLGQPLAVTLVLDDQPQIRRFAKGIGTQSRSRLTFDLPAGCQQLSGWVGIDPAAAPHGDCVCSILVDGIQVFSQRIRGQDPAVKIDIKLEDARKLDLLVEPGEMLDLSDWVNWADLRLLK